MKQYQLKHPIWILLIYFVLYGILGQGILESSDPNRFHTEFIQYGLISLLIMIMIMWLCFATLKKQWAIFRSSQNKIKQLLSYFTFLFLGNLLVNLVLSPFAHGEVENQLANELLVKVDPFISGFLIIVFAPIVEEIVFRGVIFHFFRKRKKTVLPIFVSGFVFGFFHILASLIVGNFYNTIFILSYGMLGCLLAYFYYETETLWYGIFSHSLYNFLGLLIILLVK